uniref:Uncharacterized protein n=1 Tax=Anguilla anguilla TaxID=7936 RepID=A0A0E9X4Y0_ANGAN
METTSLSQKMQLISSSKTCDKIPGMDSGSNVVLLQRIDSLFSASCGCFVCIDLSGPSLQCHVHFSGLSRQTKKKIFCFFEKSKKRKRRSVPFRTVTEIFDSWVSV